MPSIPGPSEPAPEPHPITGHPDLTELRVPLPEPAAIWLRNLAARENLAPEAVAANIVLHAWRAWRESSRQHATRLRRADVLSSRPASLAPRATEAL